jgi:hypothetical protein
LAFRTWRLLGTVIEFSRLDNADCREIAHRFVPRVCSSITDIAIV